MASAAPTPLVQRSWRQEAARAVRLAALGVREARTAAGAASETGEKALQQLLNTTLSMAHLPQMPLHALSDMPGLKAAAAAKYVDLATSQAAELMAALSTVTNAAKAAGTHVASLMPQSVVQSSQQASDPAQGHTAEDAGSGAGSSSSSTAQPAAVTLSEPWQRSDTGVLGGAMSVPKAAQLLLVAARSLALDAVDKAAVCVAAVAQAKAQSERCMSVCGVDPRQAAVLLHELEQVQSQAGVLSDACTAAAQFLSSFKGSAAPEPAANSTQQASNVQPTAEPWQLLAVPQLEARATVWLCVWMSAPHVQEGQVDEAVGAVAEALAACV